jgi:hypothetical protein
MFMAEEAKLLSLNEVQEELVKLNLERLERIKEEM